jgi:hypothetical protein
MHLDRHKVTATRAYLQLECVHVGSGPFLLLLLLGHLSKKNLMNEKGMVPGRLELPTLA